MVDLIKSFFESWSERIRSPFLSSFTVVFLALNWKGLFVLIWSDLPAIERVEYFEHHVNLSELLWWPLVGGLILPAVLESLKVISALSIQIPEDFLHLRKVKRAEKRRGLEYKSRKDEEIERLRADDAHATEHAEFLAKREKELLSQAERDKDAAGFGEEVEDQLKDLRKNIAYSESFGASEAQRALFPSVKLDRLEEEVLKFFVKRDSPIPVSKDFVSLLFQARDLNFSKLFPVTHRHEESARTKVEVDHAIKNLRDAKFLGVVHPHGEPEYQVTKAGYVYYDQKLADY